MERDDNIENLEVESVDAELNKDEYIAKLNDDLIEQKKKSDEYFEQLRRNMAEFDNFKKRMSKERDNSSLNAKGDLLEDIIPIIDNFESAVVSDCSDSQYKDGIMMIYSQLKEVLTKLGLEEIKSLGETFNPHYHEAVMHIEDENFSDRQIIEVFRKGYKIGTRVLRHAMVKVAN